MSYTPQNASVYLAAYAGALGGMGLSGRFMIDPNGGDYAYATLSADAFAQQVDSYWASQQGGTPSSFEQNALLSASKGIWEQGSPLRAPDAFVPGNYLGPARAVVALVLAANSRVATQGVNPQAPTSWITVLDLDFSAQPSQTLTTDGAYTIGTDLAGNALSWTKINSADDATAMAVTNGSGLIIKPNAASNIGGSVFTAPAITLPLTSIAALQNGGLSLNMPLRVWMYVAADNPAANADQTLFGLYVKNGGFANQFSLLGYKGFQGNNGWGNLQVVLNSTILYTSPAVPLSTNNVGSIVYPMGFLGGYSPLSTGVFASGWPAVSGLNLTTAAGITSASSGAISSAGSGAHTLSDVNLVLAAYRDTSVTSFSTTIGRVRIDYLPTFAG